MSNSPFQLLFLGEDFAWSKLCQALSGAPRASIKIHRAQSLNELFLVLAGGTWHAVALDVHAWNFQGLHYVDKLRSEYPTLPILALHSSSVNDLDNKARNVGASHTLAFETLNCDGLIEAIFSALTDLHPHSHVREDTHLLASSAELPATRAQAISHALNNLLCVITANADLLAEQLTRPSAGERSLAEIKKAAKSASDLMRQLK